eukprot:CAMPEP_0117443308 /NCGR_PEP_ID=MMETSP0759-20121206/4625_1 /TAXON_ID=63605 /ORGANISM="Percolomonas cosmopolitus, Strain WS" /LENGTH=880 /DNA_ID=CAMNT_0005235273 /DNA_START=44 /DNA_END=2686 /DNA_ORIENTATION=-
MTEPHLSQSYISPYSQRVLKDEQHSPIKDFLSKRKQQLNNQKQIQNRLENAQKQKTEMILYAGQSKSLGDINVTMGLDIVTARNYELTSMKGLLMRPDLKSLNLHHNYLVSFKCLDEQPQMEEFHVPMNTICSFYGFSYQPKLKWVNLNGNPIVKHGLYRIMCLIVGNLNIKMIGKKPVMFREKQAAEMYLSLFPLARDAIRAGWLIDLDQHPATSNENTSESAPTFESIAHAFHSVDMDDAMQVKHTDQFQKLIHGDFVKFKLEYFEKWLQKKLELQNKKKGKRGTKGKGKNGLAAKDQKIKLLKKRIEKLKRDLKQQRSFSQQQIQLQSEMRERIKEEIRAESNDDSSDAVSNDIPRIEVEPAENSSHKSHLNQDTTLTMDDIVYFDVLQCHSFAYVINPHDGHEKRCNKVKLQLSADSCIIITQNDILEHEILYSEIQKNTFYLGDTGLSRLHISLTNGDTVDLFSRNLELAKSAFKALHMFIEAHKHSITRVVTPSTTPVSGKRGSSAVKQAWSDEAMEDLVQNGPASEQNGTAHQQIGGVFTAADAVEGSYYFNTPDSSKRQLNFDEIDLEDEGDVGFEQQDPIELASSSYDNVDESAIVEEEERDEDEEGEAMLLATVAAGEGTLDEEASPTLLTATEMEGADQKPVDEEEMQPGQEGDLLEPQEETSLDAVITREAVETENLTEEAQIEESPAVAEETLIDGEEIPEETTSPEFPQEDEGSQNLARYEEEDRRLQDGDVLGADHEDESLLAPNEAGADDGSRKPPKPIQAPLLHKENEKAPKIESKIQLKPVEEESEEERRAREEREREMKALLDAFQRRAQEYGREAASEWLKEELARLSPPERIRKELEVLERFHLVSEAKKLFERGAGKV